MNIQEYISSGIIESYVLGDLSAKECAELEALASSHPEIKAEIDAVEQTLMTFAAKTPPAHIKQNILKQLDLNEDKVVQLKPGPSYLGWVAAASIALLLGSAIYNIVLSGKIKTAEEQLAAVNAEKEKYAKDYESQSNSYVAMMEQMDILMQPENKKVMLKGMDISPSALATVYWNEKSQDVYINVNSLPAPAQDKQYQLWAIVDGKPVDMGMLDLDPESPPLHKMKPVAGAQAFAVTLEKKGGNPSPTLEAMYLMGNV